MLQDTALAPSAPVAIQQLTFALPAMAYSGRCSRIKEEPSSAGFSVQLHDSHS